MLTPRYFSAYCAFLEFGCRCKFFPYIWDPTNRRLQRGSANQWFYFSIHRAVIITMLTFSSFRLFQAFSLPQFPLLLKILNIAWVGGYSLALIGLHQFDVNDREIRQFGNWLLHYSDPIRGSSQLPTKQEVGGGKAGWVESLGARTPMRAKTKEEKREEHSLGLHLLFGLLLFLGNPGVHTTLVENSTCAPHFTSSLAFPCVGYSAEGVPFLHKVPFIFIEYYLICTMFISITYNWAMVYLGMSWLLKEINAFRRELGEKGVGPGVGRYRGVEVVSNLLNDAFSFYLASFPSLLFFMVASLAFGVVRLLHVAPLANLMFPLCSTECLYDALTPLAVAGDINVKTKELLINWRQRIAASTSSGGKGGKKGGRREQRLELAYCKSYNGIRLRSGHFYTFENTIVLVCLHNCIQLTLNLLVTFKAQ